MKIAIVTFEPEIKHLPIAVNTKEHWYAFQVVCSGYDFGVDYNQMELHIHHVLDYLSEIFIVQSRSERRKIATINIVKLKEVR